MKSLCPSVTILQSHLQSLGKTPGCEHHILRASVQMHSCIETIISHICRVLFGGDCDNNNLNPLSIKFC